MNSIQQKTYNYAFKGVYGYMMLRFIGFCFIVFSQLAICIILTNAALLLEGDPDAFSYVDFSVISYLIKLSNVGKPIIMCSLFALVFEKSKKIIHALIFYFVMAVLFYIGEIITINYLLEPFVHALLETYNLDLAIVSELFPFLHAYIISYANMNIFLDMFLCVLMYLFIVYTPAFVKGRWIYLYRSLVIIPIGYIVASTLLVILNNYEVIMMSNVTVSGLLVKGSLPSFIVFLALICFIKIRKKMYEKENNILPYDEYLKTSSYTFSYSLFLALVLALISIVEYGLSFIPNIEMIGLGQEYLLFFAIPFVLLYNVSKPAKKIWPKIALPAFMTVHYTVFGLCILVVVTTVLDVVSKLLSSLA